MLQYICDKIFNIFYTVLAMGGKPMGEEKDYGKMV